MLRRFLLLAIAALLIWRIAAVGLSSHHVERLSAGDTESAGKALAWSARQPRALFQEAVALSSQDPTAAEVLAERAYAENPADTRPLIVTALLAQSQGDQTRAAALVKTAVQLAPSDPWIHKQAANYWASRGDLENAMRQWSLALEANPAARDRLFPVLLTLAEDTRARPAFQPIAVAPPSWWEPFFEQVARRAQSEETVHLLYALRRDSSQEPVTVSERQAYVARLQKDGMINEAYIEWVNGLDRQQRAQLGLLHDGGFELEPTNWGFDWHVRSTPKALVDRAHTYGVSGDKALHLLFKDQKGRFSEVYQPLFLDPGPYRLSGRVRTDSLESTGGLKWSARCLQPEVAELGESERFLGSNQWRDFAFEFQIPDSCRLQEIRLVSAGRRSFEYRISGGAWFDQMAIRRIPALTRAADTVRGNPPGAGAETPDAVATSRKAP